MSPGVALLVTESRGFASAALALYVVGLLVAFGARAWLQVRRTGDSGLRKVSSDTHPAGRLGSALFLLSLLLGLVGLVVTAVAPTWRIEVPAWIRWAGLVLALVGLVAVWGAQIAMGASWRVGVDPRERTDLVTDGIFGVVRNPIFTAMGIAMMGVALMVPNIATIAALVCFVAGVQMQVRFVEEPYLERVHGDDYRRYTERTGRFIPGLR